MFRAISGSRKERVISRVDLWGLVAIVFSVVGAIVINSD